MNKIELYAWSCDFNSNTGEGILSQNFCKTLTTEKKICIKLLSPDISALVFKSNIKTKKKINIKNIKLLHYLYPFLGIIYLWSKFLIGKKVMYLNYLPLWNFLIFLLLPPNTLLGPITGGGKIQINKNNYLRKYLFPKLYRISLFILKIRQKNLLFSTDLLKKFIDKKIHSKCFFLFCLNLLEEKKKIIEVKKKKIDILFYYNKHPNKFSLVIIKLIDRLLKKNVKISCIGERYHNKKVNYIGRVSREKTWKLMKYSKLSLMSSENYLSLFLLDCLVCNLKVITSIDEFLKIKKYFNKDNFLIYSSKNSEKKIDKIILNNLKRSTKTLNKKISNKNIIKINKKNKIYFSNLLNK